MKSRGMELKVMGVYLHEVVVQASIILYGGSEALALIATLNHPHQLLSFHSRSAAGFLLISSQDGILCHWRMVLGFAFPQKRYFVTQAWRQEADYGGDL